MGFKIGTKAYVKQVYSGGNFDAGDIVTIVQIGDDDGDNYYGAISPHDNKMWYLYEDEIEAATNADIIRNMSDEELAEFLDAVQKNPCYSCCVNADRCLRNNVPEPVCKRHYLEWLKEPIKSEIEG